MSEDEEERGWRPTTGQLTTSVALRSSKKTPDGLSTFHLFPNLPAELRRKIWHHALPGPRIIQVHYRPNSYFFRGASPPPVLHTCRASREVARSVFEPAFIARKYTNKLLPPIYIDFAHDTIHLTTRYTGWETPYTNLAWLFPDTQNIQSLAVEVYQVSLPDEIKRAFTDIVEIYGVSLPDEIERAIYDIDIASGKMKGNLREVVVVVGHQSHLLHDQRQRVFV